MRIIIRKHGSPEVLETVEENIPEPQKGEVRVRVLAAGVGYSDVMAQRGGYPLAPRRPFTPGYDFTGIVDKVGKSVVGFSVGQHVAALNPGFGCYAEYLCVRPNLLVPFSSSLDPVEVCSLILNYLTAYSVAHKKGHITAGQSVLVHSAAGGVGSALVQLCNLAGVQVYGTASSAKHTLLREWGAYPIDYKTQDFLKVVRANKPEGLDAAFDPIGGMHLIQSYRAVKSGGRVVSYGFAGSQFGGLLPMAAGVVELAALNAFPDGKCVSLCALPSEMKRDNHGYKQTLNLLIDLLATSKIKPLIGAKFPLREANKAHALLESGQVSGKIILQC